MGELGSRVNGARFTATTRRESNTRTLPNPPQRRRTRTCLSPTTIVPPPRSRLRTASPNRRTAVAIEEHDRSARATRPDDPVGMLFAEPKVSHVDAPDWDPPSLPRSTQCAGSPSPRATSSAVDRSGIGMIVAGTRRDANHPRGSRRVAGAAAKHHTRVSAAEVDGRLFPVAMKKEQRRQLLAAPNRRISQGRFMRCI